MLRKFRKRSTAVAARRPVHFDTRAHAPIDAVHQGADPSNKRRGNPSVTVGIGPASWQITTELKRKGADYHHGDLRRSLVEATVRLVADHGVDGFTLRAAAKLAGVSDGAPYHHFADKEALLAAVAEESFDLLCDEMNAAGDDHSGSPVAKSQAMSVAYVLFAARYPARFRIMWSPRRGRARHRGLEKAAQRAERLLHRCLDQSLRSDSNRGVPERAIILARAVVHGLSVLAIDGHLKREALNERSLKRIAWDAVRQLNPLEIELDPRQSKKLLRGSIVPESVPRSGSRLRPARQSA